MRPARLYAPLAPSGPPATRPCILGKASLAVCCMCAMVDFLHACGSSWVHAVWREKIRVLLMDPSCMSSVTNLARSLLYEQSACARCYSHGISIFLSHMTHAWPHGIPWLAQVAVSCWPRLGSILMHRNSCGCTPWPSPVVALRSIELRLIILNPRPINYLLTLCY